MLTLNRVTHLCFRHADSPGWIDWVRDPRPHVADTSLPPHCLVAGAHVAYCSDHLETELLDPGDHACQLRMGHSSVELVAQRLLPLRAETTNHECLQKPGEQVDISHVSTCYLHGCLMM